MRAPYKDIKRQSPRDQLGSRGLRIVNWFRQPEELSNRYGSQREPGRGALDFVRTGDVAEFVDLVARQVFEVMKFADVNSLLDQQVVVQRHERPVLIAESLRVFGARLVFDAARIAADHNRAVLFNQPFRGLDGDARRIVRRYLRVVAAGLAPVAQRPGADQYDIARLELRLLLLQSLFEVGDRDLIVARQGVEAFRSGDVYQHAPRDDR